MSPMTNGMSVNETSAVETREQQVNSKGHTTSHKISPSSFQRRRKKTSPKKGLQWFHLYVVLMIPSSLMPFLLVRLSKPHPPTAQHGDFFLPMANTTTALARADNTVVTAYFRLDSKHTTKEYNEWMSTMLRLNDAMIIFTHPNLVETIRNHRQHALERTVIVPMKLEDLPLSRKGERFWKSQLHKDPEQKRHKTFRVFWIWLSKSWFVTQAIRANPFKSDVFVWSDIGCFRNKMARTYRYKTMVAHREVIPSDSLLFLAHHTPHPPPTKWFTNRKKQKEYFYHSSSQVAGNGDVWLRYHDSFMKTLEGLMERNHFIGEDQTVAQSTCLQHAGLCAYIPFDQIKDHNFYGLRHALHHGGTYRLWRPPTATIQANDKSSISMLRRNIVRKKEETPKTKAGNKKKLNTNIRAKGIANKSGKQNAPAKTPKVKAKNTIVTAYFQLPSKSTSEKYRDWMSNMLSLEDAMVIFTSPELVSQMKRFRSHALNRTVIVPLKVEDTPLAQNYSKAFWEKELKRDPEKNHPSYQLYWVRLSKSYFVTEAIRTNPFQSDVFVWSDIVSFRHDFYNHKEMVLHREVIPRYSILQMAHHKPNLPNSVWWNNLMKEKEHFYHSGSQAAGYSDTWQRFHKRFMETLEGFKKRKMFIGEDQVVLQSTCLRFPHLCEYIPFDQIKGDSNHYFGLRHALHYGGNFSTWRPPMKKKKK